MGRPPRGRLSTCIRPTTTVNRFSAFAWCKLPRLTGTWFSSAEIPSPTCVSVTKIEASSSALALAGNRGLNLCAPHTYVTAASVDSARTL